VLLPSSTRTTCRRNGADHGTDLFDPIALQLGEIGDVQLTAIEHLIAWSDRKPATLLALHGEGDRDRSYGLELILHAAERRLLPVNYDLGYSLRALRFDKIKLLLLGAKRRFPNGCSGLALCAWKEKSWRAGGHCCCAQGLAGDLLSGRLDAHARDHALQ
jgi:hypothetical protein